MASKAIKNSGGVPVHAHPLSLYLSINTLETTMEEIKAKGVMGLEAYHPAIRVSQGQQLEKIAQAYDMDYFHVKSMEKMDGMIDEFLACENSALMVCHVYRYDKVKE